MPLSNLEAGAQPLAMFQLPTKGVWKNVSAHLIAPDALADVQNMFLFKGKLRPRPGMSDVTSSYGSVSANVILGGAFFIGGAGSPRITLASRTECRECVGIPAAFSTTSTGTYTANDNKVLDFDVLFEGTNLRGVLADNALPLLQWLPGGTGFTTITPSAGVVPSNVQSVCIAAQRVLCLIGGGGNATYAQDTLVWSAVNDHTGWPALAYAPANATQDIGTCVRQLGSIGAAIYKKRSIYVVRARAGTDASAFSLSEPFKAEGPAGIHALVAIEGRHIYMTEQGRIGIFDGTRYPIWFGDHLWQYLQEDIDHLYTHKILAVYSYRHKAILFFYPRVSDGTGALVGIVILTIPPIEQAADPLLQTAAFVGVTANPPTFGLTLYPGPDQPQAMLFDAARRPVYLDVNVQTDVASAFTGYLQTPLLPIPGLTTQQVNVELFLERLAGYGTVNVSLVTSNMLDTLLGTVSAPQTVNLTQTPVREYYGFNTPARFVGIRVDFTSTTGRPAYAGAGLYGRVTLPNGPPGRG